MPGTIDFTGWEFVDHCYGTVANADLYFAKKVQQLDDWSGLSSDQKQKALYEATQSIDRLLYAGLKNPVYELYAAATPDAQPTKEQLTAADAEQILQFPRNGGAIPEDIVIATYEEAQSIACGRNAALSLENLAVTSDGAGSTRASFHRDNAPVRHIVNGITSYFAWRFIQPFLADISTFDVRRV